MTIFTMVLIFLDFVFLGICLIGIVSREMKREDVGALITLAVVLLMNIAHIALGARW